METALEGALVRRAPNVWVWADTGEAEPRVRDLLVLDLAPNYRVIARGGRRYVEVPRDWPRDVTDPDLEESLRRPGHGHLSSRSTQTAGRNLVRTRRTYPMACQILCRIHARY